jgi:threonylcarbamoyladenosine tRNA methylthiotransferase MtaB
MFFSAYTLGCKLNQLETEAITDSFCREGFCFIPWEQSASGAPGPGDSRLEAPWLFEPLIMLINTCTVTSMAEQKARRIIRKALREHPHACLIITGCYAQMDKAALAALEGNPSGRFFVIPGEKKDRILDLPHFISTADFLAAALPELIASWYNLNFPDYSFTVQPGGGGPVPSADGAFRYKPTRFFSHSRPFLKIQDGCDRSCAYCRVSFARGKSRSLGAEEALKALVSFEQKGVGEVVLTGVNISQYRDSKMTLPGLLDFLLNGTEKVRLRLSSIEPDGFTQEQGFDEFLRVLANKRIRPHFHLSLQSGSAEILAKMGRRYTPADVEELIARLREVRDDPFLACDIIAGFPGETSGEFEKTYAFSEKIGFAWIHAFPFSPRPGTTAFGLSGRVSGKDAAQRTGLLMELARKSRLEYLRRWEGREVEAVVEAGADPPKVLVPGVSENYLKLRVNCGNGQVPLPGSLIRCRILKASDNPSGCFDALAEKTG